MPGEAAIGDEDRVGRQGSVQLAAQPRHVHRPVARIEPRRRVVLPGLHARRDLGDIIGPRRAGGRAAVRQRLGQVLEPGARIAPQRDLGGMQRPISSATMSRWMTGMCGGGSAKRLVAISPSLQPTTIRQSDASISSLAMRE